jgi:predicted permease
MTSGRSLFSRLLEVVRRSSVERDLDEELRAHRDMLIDEYRRRGLTDADAHRRATHRLGGLEQGKEIVRQARGLPSIEAFVRDCSHAVRSLLKSPLFSSVTVLTLAVGIAVDVAVFSIVDAVVLRPLPYPVPDRLLSIWETGANGRGSVAPGNLADYRRADTIKGIAGLAARTRNLTSTEQPETLQVEEVTPNYFDVLGVAPALGRPFNDGDAQPDSSRVALLSDGFWRRRFGADPGVVGRGIDLDGARYEIIGVMPAQFRGVYDLSSIERRSVWLPAAYPPELLANRGDHEIRLVARLADGATVDAARAELATISEALAIAYPGTNKEVRTGLDSLGVDIVRGVRVSLWVLLLTVGLILAIACVNIANLMLARGVGRRREIAVRFALGATRARVATALVAESTVLAVAASLIGIVLAVWIQHLLLAVAPQTIPRLDTVGVDLRVVGYAGLVTLVTGLLFGLIPAWQAGHSRANDALSGIGRVVAGASVMRWRNGLMLAQVALSAILLVGAGLMVKSLMRLNGVSLGFDPDNVVAMRMTLPERRYATADARLQFFEELERQVASMPGVEAIGFTNNLPLRGGWGSGFTIDGLAAPPDGYFAAGFQAVSPGYFPTLGITIADGRLIAPSDTSRTEPVAVVSRLFERRFLDGQPAIGRRIRRGPEAPLITIVGVVDDVRRDGKTSELEPQVYLPARQTNIYPVRLADVAVRARSRPADLVPAIRGAVWSIDPQQPISNIRTLDELLIAGSADRRFQALLFSLFALLALVLASVGTYGVVSYVVSQRIPEIGVRVALGATAWNIHRWLLGGTMLIVVSGAAIGLVGARWLSGYVETLLFDVKASDAPSYGLAAAALMAVALTASLVAGRRATAIDPTQSLRYE